MTAGWGNYVIVGWGNFLMFLRLMWGNYLTVDRRLGEVPPHAAPHLLHGAQARQKPYPCSDHLGQGHPPGRKPPADYSAPEAIRPVQAGGHGLDPLPDTAFP